MSSLDKSIQTRKQEHLDICKNSDVASQVSAGFELIELPHIALPEVDFKDVDLACCFLGKKYAAPFLISSMTGGSPDGEKINEMLARLSQEKNIPMGVGSQRVAIESKSNEFFSLRKKSPRARLWANIGAVQLNYGVTVDDLQWIVDSLEAEALILHANAMQEAIQFEGDRNFANLFEKISDLKKKITVPVILKETGCGIDALTAKRARDAGVDAIDVAGRGGTHWGFIEGLRHPERHALGEMFRNWGVSTAVTIQSLREELGPNYPLIASGGLKNGLDVAKSIFLGADLAGMAIEFLRAAAGGHESLEKFYQLQSEALRIALFCTGSKNLKELKRNV